MRGTQQERSLSFGAKARVWSVLLVLLVLGAPACTERRRSKDSPQASPPSLAPQASLAVPLPKPSRVPARSPVPEPKRARSAHLPQEMLEAAPEALPDRAASGKSSRDQDPGGGPLIVDDLVDVGPAGPASAHAQGVVLIDKQESLHIARLGALAKTEVPTRSPIGSLNHPRGAFAPYAKGPALTGRHAYWVYDGRLLRGRLDQTGKTEVLARDARNGTRVAAIALPGRPTLAAYVTVPGADKIPHAKLWVEGGAIQDLTVDGSAAISVALARQGSAVIALSLDGRSSMTPLHVRRIVPHGKEVRLGPDLVAWVGGSAQSTTEITAATRGNEVWGLLSIERDALRFGLAQIRIGTEPKMDVPALFVPFANGINTAPIAAAGLCGKSMVVFARPSTPTPDAPQELVLAELLDEGLELREVLARSRAFADVSLASLPGGGLLAYTADYRTWARTLRCRA